MIFVRTTANLDLSRLCIAVLTENTSGFRMDMARRECQISCSQLMQVTHDRQTGRGPPLGQESSTIL